ncbi:hypothetical protein GCM10027519_10540 [Kineococcus endophyticus]
MGALGVHLGGCIDGCIDGGIDGGIGGGIGGGSGLAFGRVRRHDPRVAVGARPPENHVEAEPGSDYRR